MKKTLLFIITFLLAVMALCSCQSDKNDKTFDETSYYKIINKSENDNQKYQYIIYNLDKEVVLDEETTREPAVNYLGDGLFEIVTSHGSPALLYRYYDIFNDTLSEDSFWNRAAVKGHAIAYMDLTQDSKLVLIVRDIFNKDIYYNEFERNFSPNAVPSSALTDAEFINDDTLNITYLKGEDSEEVTETIHIK